MKLWPNQNLKTYMEGFERGFDEAERLAQVALKSQAEHHQMIETMYRDRLDSLRRQGEIEKAA